MFFAGAFGSRRQPPVFGATAEENCKAGREKTGVGAGVADVLKQVNVFDQIQFGAAVAP